MPKKILYSLYFSFPLFFIRLFAVLDLSHTNEMVPPFTFSVVVFQAVMFFLLAAINYFVLLNLRKHLLWFLFSSFFLMNFFIIFCGLEIHRDFFSYSFMIVGIYYLIFLLQEQALFNKENRKKVLNFLYWFSLVFFALIFEWVILMGYSISTRTEPRWIESIIYNIYILFYSFLLIYEVIQIKNKTFNQLLVKKDSVIFADRTLTSMFSPAEILLLIEFLNHRGEVLTCSRLIKTLNRNTEGCSECIKEQFKVTACLEYKYLYNRVHSLRKIIRELQIGDIQQAEGENVVSIKGWTFLLYENIRVLLVR